MKRILCGIAWAIACAIASYATWFIAGVSDAGTYGGGMRETLLGVAAVATGCVAVITLIGAAVCFLPPWLFDDAGSAATGD